MRFLLVALLLAVPPAGPAAAAAPQVTDPAGDANAAGVAGTPASLAAYDLTAVRWYAADDAQHVAVTFADGTRADARYVVRFGTPRCDTGAIEWRTGWPTAYVEVCGERAWPAAPSRAAGRTVTFTVPFGELPPSMAPGTALGGLGATAGPYADVVVGALYPAADTAASQARYVVGS
ncbi:MAG TPA: hypothetical protein VNA20_00465 [Frankiaceae bacterium]|nr:hypothetical protein [Frankiaceae bacterium]